MNKKQRGFTLIELLISVAILGILAKIAYPSYSENIRQGKRKDAEAALTSFANAMEMYRIQNNNSYLGAGPSGANTGTPAIFSAVVPVSGGATTYDLTISAATATTYTLSAAPVSTDSLCSTLTLDNLGNKTPTTAGCW